MHRDGEIVSSSPLYYQNISISSLSDLKGINDTDRAANPVKEVFNSPSFDSLLQLPLTPLPLSPNAPRSPPSPSDYDPESQISSGAISKRPKFLDKQGEKSFKDLFGENTSSSLGCQQVLTILVKFLAFVVVALLSFNSVKSLTMSNFAFRSGARGLSVATWNVAAINNNPFEYWITMKGHPAYNKMMVDVENFIENPGSEDVAVNKVFTDVMYDSLEKHMGAAGFKDLPKVREFWENDFKSRPIITGFMKDKSLGSKRLTSMPDRYTNTINVVGSSDPVCRPTVINMYEGDLSTLDLWWEQWR